MLWVVIDFNYCYPVGEEVMDDWAEVRGGGFTTM